MFCGDAYVTRCAHTFDCLFAQELPVLWEHFRSLHIESTLFFTPWIRSFFMCSSTDLRLAVRFLDVLLVFGVEVFFRVAIGILRLLQERLLTEKEFIPLLHVLKNFGDLPVDHIMAAAHAIDSWAGLEKELQLERRHSDERSDDAKEGDLWCLIS
mmetsp:Transcript_16053/g.41227  ORF Transcript_16053/g.41227 Transcript_16053/m.41227 type:complete len:155 (-) Transcript_16053:1242-1706(-)